MEKKIRYVVDRTKVEKKGMEGHKIPVVFVPPRVEAVRPAEPKEPPKSTDKNA